jgi:hypothetical protein
MTVAPKTLVLFSWNMPSQTILHKPHPQRSNYALSIKLFLDMSFAVRLSSNYARTRDSGGSMNSIVLRRGVNAAGTWADPSPTRRRSVDSDTRFTVSLFCGRSTYVNLHWVRFICGQPTVYYVTEILNFTLHLDEIGSSSFIRRKWFFGMTAYWPWHIQ